MKAAEIEDAKPPKRLAKFHGGAVTSLLVSPVGHLIATTSMDGWFHVHCVLDKQLVYMEDFKEPITSSVWLPPKVIVLTGYPHGYAPDYVPEVV